MGLVPNFAENRGARSLLHSYSPYGDLRVAFLERSERVGETREWCVNDAGANHADTGLLVSNRGINYGHRAGFDHSADVDSEG